VSAILDELRQRRRHETALALPDKSRLSVLFWKKLNVDGEDFAAISSAAGGAVVPLTKGAVTRLKTDLPL
jgi:hypothetical protein